MLHEIDLRALAELRGPERAFLSFYGTRPDPFGPLEGRIRQVRALLAGQPDEREHFDRSLELARAALEADPDASGPVCLFACWALDYCKGYPLPTGVEVPTLLRIDAAPFIRPLAELQDEYENFLIVAADNTATRILQVTSAVADEAERIKGNVKNAVKVGGWSQQRYARRRDKQLQGYAREISGMLDELFRTGRFSRLVLLGSAETLREIESELSPQVAEKLAGSKPVDLKAGGDDDLVDEAHRIAFEQEREAEQELWGRVRGELLRGGLGAAGPADVLAAVAAGRADSILLDRDVKLTGTRCRDCENVADGERPKCAVCGSESVFPVDLADELARQAELTSASVEFADPIDGLAELGGVAALLRY